MHIKKILVISIALAVLAFGTYGINTWVNSKIAPAKAAPPAADKPAAPVLVSVSAGPNNPTVTCIQILTAPELPARVPDAGGAFTGRDGNTLTLNSFMITTSGSTVSTGTMSSAGMGTITAITPGDLAQGTLTVSSSSDSCVAVSQGEIIPPDSGRSSPLTLQGLPGSGSGQLTITNGVPPVPGEGSSSVIVGGSALPAQATPQKVVVTDATKIYHDGTPTIDPSTGGSKTLQQVVEPGSLDNLSDQTMLTVWGHMDGGQLVADVILYQNPPVIK